MRLLDCAERSERFQRGDDGQWICRDEQGGRQLEGLNKLQAILDGSNFQADPARDPSLSPPSPLRAQRRRTDRARRYLSRGDVQMDAENFEQAATYFEQAYTELGTPDLAVRLGLCYEHSGFPLLAAENYRAAMQTDGVSASMRQFAEHQLLRVTTSPTPESQTLFDQLSDPRQTTFGYEGPQTKLTAAGTNSSDGQDGRADDVVDGTDAASMDSTLPDSRPEYDSADTSLTSGEPQSLLDYESAFDELSTDGYIEALARLGSSSTSLANGNYDVVGQEGSGSNATGDSAQGVDGYGSVSQANVVEQAEGLMNSGRFTESLAVFEKALVAEGRDNLGTVKAFTGAATCLANLGRHQEAIDRAMDAQNTCKWSKELEPLFCALDNVVNHALQQLNGVGVGSFDTVYIDPKATRNEQAAENLLEAKPAGETPDADQLSGVGKLYSDAYANDPTIERAFLAGLGFAMQKDFERAARMYRLVLQDPDRNVPDEWSEQNDQLKRAAQRYLDTHQLDDQAKYPFLKKVHGSYVDSPDPSPLAQEEKRQDGADLHDRTVWIAMKTGAHTESPDARLLRFKDWVEVHHGLDVNAQDLLIESYVENYGRKDGESMEQVRQRLQNDFGIDARLSGAPTDFPTPLLKDSEERVKYLKTTEQRNQYRFGVDGEGRLMRGPDQQQPFDTSEFETHFSGKGWAIYVMDPDGKMYAHNHKVGRFHHSSFLAGSEAAGAGEIKVENGVIKVISNKSGHYQPSPIQLVQTLQEVRSGLGQDLSQIQVRVLGNDPSDFDQHGWPARYWPGDGDQPGNAEQFLTLFNTDRDAFRDIWHGKLGFQNDPYAGLPE